MCKPAQTTGAMDVAASAVSAMVGTTLGRIVLAAGVMFTATQVVGALVVALVPVLAIAFIVTTAVNVNRANGMTRGPRRAEATRPAVALEAASLRHVLEPTAEPLALEAPRLVIPGFVLDDVKDAAEV